MKKHISAIAFAGLLALAGCSKVPTGSAEAAGNPGALGVSGGRSIQELTIPEGTSFRVRLLETLDTRRNRAGDKFMAALDEPLVDGDRVVVPKGTNFSGHIVTSKSSGRFKGRAVLASETGFLRDGWPNLRDPEQQLFPGKRGTQETSLPLDWRGIGWRSSDWSNCRRRYRSADRRGCGRGSWNRGLGDYRQAAGEPADRDGVAVQVGIAGDSTDRIIIESAEPSAFKECNAEPSQSI